MRLRPVLLLAAGAAALALAGALAGAIVVALGLYDVAATEQHYQPIHTLLETTMRQSVRLRARGVAEPAPAGESAQLRGAACYRDKCLQCHGAPGVAQGDIGRSMQPLPGPLVDATQHWRPRELYWVTRHGIRMSGMPAWEHRLTESEVWDVVAFVQQLPRLNAADWADWMRRAPPAPACGRELQARPAAAGDAERGRRALHQYACTACHTIPGAVGSNPHVGPPLAGMARRTLIAGTLANTPDNLVLWLRDTQGVKPGTAMPAMGVDEQDARDIAAFLATLH